MVTAQRSAGDVNNMSEWSKNPPTEPGWYWWRRYSDSLAEPTEVAETCYYWHGTPVIAMGGEWWLERIEPPVKE